MSSERDTEAQILADLVRRDPFRPEYEKGFQPWPESAIQKKEATRKNGPVRLTLRMPRHPYDQAKRSARRDGTSLNTFLVGAVAKHVGDELGYERGVRPDEYY